MMSRTSLHPPRQKRSEATLSRLVKASERLLETTDWESLSITSLVREGRSSVGAFYARFTDKDSFLDYLDERYANDVILLFEALAQRAADPSRELRDRLLDVTSALTDFYAKRRGVARAVVLRARLRREARFSARTELMKAAIAKLYAALAEDPAIARLSHPEAEVRLAFSIAFSTIRERVLFPETIEGPDEGELDVAQRIADILALYLQR